MKKTSLLFLATMLFALACKKEEIRKKDDGYDPEINPSFFSNPTEITNPYFPYPLGKKYIYEGITPDGMEHNEIVRVPGERVVYGIACAVVNDKVWIDGVLVEDTDDWYAQDDAGNVWYLGEEVDILNPDGSIKDHHGAWESGVDGAKPGIIMLSDPHPGETYREEYYFGEAEDQGSILEVGITVTIPYGTFENCLKLKNWTELDPGLLEHKFYAPGIGLLIERNLETNQDEIQLIDIQN